MRVFNSQSLYNNGNVNIAIAPALTPIGIVKSPTFFHGTVIYPDVFARSLVILSEIVSTRYYEALPTSLFDPILSAQGDMLRAECFSSCYSVYARLDLLQSGFDGEIGFGTTNIDIGTEFRNTLMNVKKSDKMSLTIGEEGLKSTHTDDENFGKVSVEERAVKMPDRWYRSLGNVANIHMGMKEVFKLNKIQTQAFITSIPGLTGKDKPGYYTVIPTGLKENRIKVPKSIYLTGLTRLSAIKRVLTNVNSATFYEQEGVEKGKGGVVFELDGAKLTISMTSKLYEGYSGEGSLLKSIAMQNTLDNADKIDSILEFDSIIDINKLTVLTGLTHEEVKESLDILASSGKVGYDVSLDCYYHRELPFDADRVDKDNPRYAAAKKLVKDVYKTNDNQWIVESKDINYRVTFEGDITNAKCTCTWYLKHKNQRGPCKHILAVALKENIIC